MRLCRVGAPFVVFLAAISMQGAEDSKPVSPSFVRTPQRLVRGKYLAELAHCFDCHSERDAKGNQIPGMKGAGRVLPPEESNIPRPHFLVCPNITPDRETGAGSWSDLQLARAVREGIGHDGRILDKTMPYWNFRYLTDEDLASIIVFLRSIPLCLVDCRPSESWNHSPHKFRIARDSPRICLDKGDTSNAIRSIRFCMNYGLIKALGWK